MRSFLAGLVGLFTAFFAIVLLIALGTTEMHVYSLNTFHNGVMFCMLLVVVSTATEYVLDSCSKEMLWDVLASIIISVIATTFIYKNSGLPFTGELHLFEIIKKIWVPVVIQIAIALFGSNQVSKIIAANK